MHNSILFFESRINCALAFSPKITYVLCFSGPVALEKYVIVDNNQYYLMIRNWLAKKIPEVNLCSALLILTEVELIPPHRPLSEETVMITFFLTSTPRIATQGKTMRATKNQEWKICIGQKGRKIKNRKRSHKMNI